jgi:hypothetical protein
MMKELRFTELSWMCQRCRTMYPSSGQHKLTLACLSQRDYYLLLAAFFPFLQEMQRVFADQLGRESLVKNRHACFAFPSLLHDTVCLECGMVLEDESLEQHLQEGCAKKRLFPYHLFTALWKTYSENLAQGRIPVALQTQEWRKKWRVIETLLSQSPVARVPMKGPQPFYTAHITQENWNKCFEHTLVRDEKDIQVQERLAKPFTLQGLEKGEKTSIDLQDSGIELLIGLILQDPRNQNLMVSAEELHYFEDKKRSATSNKDKEKDKPKNGNDVKSGKKGTRLKRQKQRKATTTEDIQQSDIQVGVYVTKVVTMWGGKDPGCAQVWTLDSRTPQFQTIMRKCIEEFVSKLWDSLLGTLPNRRWPIDPSHLSHLQEQTSLFLGLDKDYDLENDAFQRLFQVDHLLSYRCQVPKPAPLI